MKNILILGAGFIGGNLARSLLKFGYNVKILSKTNPSIKNVIFREALWQDIDKHDDFFCNVDIVVHTISTTVPYTSMLDIQKDVQDNILTNIKLLDILRYQKVPKVIFISSGGSIYGNPKEKLVIENHPQNPISSYGITKLTTEHYFNLYEINYGIKTISLRPSNVYGIGQKMDKPQGVIVRLLNCALNDLSFDIWGNGEGIKDYLNIEDLIDAIIRVIQVDFFYENKLNISSGECYSINNLVKLIEQITNKRIVCNYHEAKTFDVQNIIINSEKFRKYYNWTPKNTLRSSIESMYKLLKNR